MIRVLILFSLAILSSINYGCSPTGALATGGATTIAVAEGERTIGTLVDDATIKLNISRKLLGSENKLFLNIDTRVVEGRVLLTGIVNSQEDRIDAVRKVWEVEGVKEVMNEVEVGNQLKIKEYANDLWIKTQIRALTAKNAGLSSLAFNFEVIKGKVYMAGITSDKEELDIVIQTIKGVKGVKELVNYIIVKD